MATNQPVILVVLDGFGINPKKEGNAIANASMPNMDSLLRNYPTSSLSMSGLDVGLPDGQMGNSEVGHMILGAGRIVYQDLTLIHKDIDEGNFDKNPIILNALRTTKAAGGRLHLMGLLGDGGVHSHQRHMEALIEMAQREKVGPVYLHLFLDGRDTPPNSAEQFILDLNEKLKAWPDVKIATLIGRYYAMDRDKRWDRVEKAYLCLTEGAGKLADSPLEAIRNSYKEDVTDEFVLPTAIRSAVPEGLIRDGDGVIFFNFRADRARELTRALIDADFKEFPRKRRSESVDVHNHDPVRRDVQSAGSLSTPGIAKDSRRGCQPARAQATTDRRNREIRPRDVLLQWRRRKRISRRTTHSDSLAERCPDV